MRAIQQFFRGQTGPRMLRHAAKHQHFRFLEERRIEIRHVEERQHALLAEETELAVHKCGKPIHPFDPVVTVLAAQKHRAASLMNL